MMPLQSSSFEETKLKPNERIQIKDSSLAPEKQFEPWISSVEPSNTSYFTRNYGWDEIEQNEDETKQLRQLFSIWDAERIAILKLQHDLDKNIFQRKRMHDIININFVSFRHIRLYQTYRSKYWISSVVMGSSSSQLFKYI
jgi:hypothetical protein